MVNCDMRMLLAKPAQLRDKFRLDCLISTTCVESLQVGPRMLSELLRKELVNLLPAGRWNLNMSVGARVSARTKLTRRLVAALTFLLAVSQVMVICLGVSPVTLHYWLSMAQPSKLVDTTMRSTVYVVGGECRPAIVKVSSESTGMWAAGAEALQRGVRVSSRSAVEPEHASWEKQVRLGLVQLLTVSSGSSLVSGISCAHLLSLKRRVMQPVPGSEFVSLIVTSMSPVVLTVLGLKFITHCCRALGVIATVAMPVVRSEESLPILTTKLPVSFAVPGFLILPTTTFTTPIGLFVGIALPIIRTSDPLLPWTLMLRTEASMGTPSMSRQSIRGSPGSASTRYQPGKWI